MEKSYSIPGFKDVSIGASDSVILGISVVGFGILSLVTYRYIIRNVKSADELEAEALTPEELLARADVSTLSRAQRRARAKVIMKEQRRAHIPTNDTDAPPSAAARPPSRKERQKAAKLAEQRERQVNAQARVQDQEEAQKRAQKQKLQRQLQKQLQEERLQAEQRELELARRRVWGIFLEPTATATRNGPQSVVDFVHELETQRTVDLGAIATSFGVPVKVVRNRIETLMDEGRVAGYFDANNPRFVYVSDNELDHLAKAVLEKGHVTLAETAKICQQVLSS